MQVVNLGALSLSAHLRSSGNQANPLRTPLMIFLMPGDAAAEPSRLVLLLFHQCPSLPELGRGLRHHFPTKLSELC